VPTFQRSTRVPFAPSGISQPAGGTRQVTSPGRGVKAIGEPSATAERMENWPQILHLCSGAIAPSLAHRMTPGFFEIACARMLWAPSPRQDLADCACGSMATELRASACLRLLSPLALARHYHGVLWAGVTKSPRFIFMWNSLNFKCAPIMQKKMLWIAVWVKQNVSAVTNVQSLNHCEHNDAFYLLLLTARMTINVINK
jgi:hypothetical protein